MNGILYRIFNIKTGKSYIGKTYRGFYYRLSEHIRSYNRFPDRPLYRAFIKYGIEAFSAEIIGEFPEGSLEIKEAEYIKYYKAYGSNGYNATLGGDGARHKYLEPEKVVKLYSELGSIKLVSKELKTDVLIIRKTLRDNKVILKSTKTIARELKSPRIYIPEVGMCFEDLYSCIDFLRDAEILNEDTTDKAASNSIHRVCKRDRSTYKGIVFSYSP